MEANLLKICVIFLTSVIPSGAQLSGITGRLSDVTDDVLTAPLVSGSVNIVGKALGQVDDPDINKNVVQLLVDNGYPCENHVVKTKDGYILNMQRIPHGRKCDSRHRKREKKEVVFLAHGLLATADSYLIQQPHQSIGFILADAGYDVWLGNFRGTRYCFSHVKYTEKDRAFWDFSLDHLAAYDTPAMIDYILKVTKCGQVSVIAESLGTSAIFALLAESPEFNRKIKVFIAMSPVSYCSHMLRTTRTMCLYLKDYDRTSGPHAMLKDSKLGHVLKQVACNTLLRGLTCEPMFSFVGAQPHYMNKTRLGVYMSHFPTVTSTRIIAHYGQNIASKGFKKFNYGPRKNKIIYHQSEPPDYDLSRISTPVALMWAVADTLSPPEDVELLRRDLRSLVVDYRVPDEHFEHLDFAIGTRACELVFPKILQILRAFRGTRRLGH